MSNNCAILVNSCDKYAEAWYPFFTLLKKYWPDCPYPMYLNTETYSYTQHPVTVLNSTESLWGNRLYQALIQIDCEYVIVLLEDFFIRKPVDAEEIANCIERMRSNSDISVFYFSRITGYKSESTEYSKYYQMNPEEQPKPGRYMINCQAAIWRKSVLMEAVKNIPSPWELEENAFAKLSEKFKQTKYYCLKNTWYDNIRDSDVFSYVLVREKGYGIWQSKWLWNNKKLFKKEGIKVNFKNLGYLPHWKYKLTKITQRIKGVFTK